MLNIYLTTVPLQGKFDLEKIAYGSTLPGGESIQTRFPILQVIHDTMQPNDSAQVLVIRQKNADTARNYTYLLEELAAQGYQWNREDFPSCGIQPASEETVLPSDIPVPSEVPVPSEIPTPSGEGETLMSVGVLGKEK